MTQTLSDDFNRADGTLGANWADVLSDTLSISSNRVAGVLNVWCVSFNATSCDTDDNFSQTTIAVTGNYPGVMCRGSGANTTRTHYLWFLDASGNSARIRKVVNNTETDLGSAYGVTDVNGDVLKISASGSTITGWYNGSNAQQITDTAITTGKKVGLGGYSATTARLDDWSGGDLSSGATALTIQSATHAQTAGNVTLSATVPTFTLTIQSATHASSATAPALTQHQILAVQGSTHASSAGNVALTQHQILAVAGATHAQSADNVTLTAHGIGGVVLTIADTAHAHTASTVTLSTTVPTFALTVADSAHAHAADTLSLSATIPTFTLTIASAAHAHTADTVTFGGFCVVYRPALGTTTRPSSGVTIRPGCN